MLQQKCQQCHNQYDYFTRTATVVCARNHVLCRLCANQLATTTRLCPQCGMSTISHPGPGLASGPVVNAYGNNDTWNHGGQYYNQPALHNGGYWQPSTSTSANQGFANNPQPYIDVNNQGFQPQPYQPIPVRQKNPGGLCCAAIFFTIIASVMLSVRIRMNHCQYWSYYTCYFYKYDSYLCCDSYSSCTSSAWSYCYDVAAIQDRGSTIGMTIGIAFVGALAFIMFISFIKAKRMNMANANYVRV